MLRARTRSGPALGRRPPVDEPRVPEQAGHEQAGERRQRPQQVDAEGQEGEPDGDGEHRLAERVHVPPEQVGLGGAVVERDREHLEAEAERRQRDERDRPGDEQVRLLPPEMPILEDGEATAPEALTRRQERRSRRRPEQLPGHGRLGDREPATPMRSPISSGTTSGVIAKQTVTHQPATTTTNPATPSASVAMWKARAR